MTCITHAILPTAPDPQLTDWKVERYALRRIVRTILQAGWPVVEAAWQDWSKRSSVRFPRYTPSELVNQLSVDNLLCIALGVRGTLDLTDWLDRKVTSLNPTDWHDKHALLAAHRHNLRDRMFGPFASEEFRDIAGLYLWDAGHRNALVGWIVRTDGHAHVSWLALTARPTTALAAGSDDLSLWSETMRPVAHRWLTAQGRKPIMAATLDTWEMRLLRGAAASPTKPTTTTTTTNPTTTTLETTTMTAITINEAMRSPLSALLTAAGLPDVNEVLAKMSERDAAVAALTAANDALDKLKATASGPGITLKIDAALAKPAQAQAGWPAYTMVTRKAADVFSVPPAQAKPFDFDVPVFDWSGPCSHVPAIDDTYLFRPQLLLSVLYALLTGDNLWLSGHTGTGKSTLVEQVCARLGWPMARVNLDSEITRLDLMGRDILTQVNGQTVTRFEEGILPWALQRPVVLLLDECDLGRPDIMYCMQRVNEGTGLTLTEDGGRHVAPHPLFRVIATANTLGQGDDSGLYQGARIQSAAFLDRFTVWSTVEPMDQADIAKLVMRRVPDLAKDEAQRIAQYVREHGTAFRERQVGTPVSPRSAIAVGKAMVMFASLLPAEKAREKALAQAIVDRAPETDRKVLVGIIDRVWK